MPPTLTNRIALLITRPAPFDFQTAEPVVVLPRFLEADLQIAAMPKTATRLGATAAKPPSTDGANALRMDPPLDKGGW